MKMLAAKTSLSQPLAVMVESKLQGLRNKIPKRGAIMPSNSKSCRNCGSHEIYSREVNARGGQGPNLLPIGFFTSSTFLIRVCGDCGLVEWFVPPKHLNKVKEKFQREAG
jgi:predicted nucleic-acid-binding Zn-ribbon protein